MQRFVIVQSAENKHTGTHYEGLGSITEDGAETMWEPRGWAVVVWNTAFWPWHACYTPQLTVFVVTFSRPKRDQAS